MKTDKKSIISILKSFVFFIISIFLFIYFKNGINEFDSVLDKYLNFNYIVLMQVFSIINSVFAICFFVLFILSVAKRNKDNKISSKIISAVLIIIFITTNAVSGILIIHFQANENTVMDTIPESVGAYVDFNKIFKNSPDNDYFNEQTVYNKVSTEIPVNYNVQQSSSDSSVKTSCIQITDDKLLAEYYSEQEERCSRHKIIDFNADELTLMSADKGFYYIADNYNLNIVIVKDDKLFDIYMFSENIKLTDEIIQQIAAL